jgi:hypothetical protein
MTDRPIDPAELRDLAREWTPPPVRADCHCDLCEALRRDRLRALTPSQRRGIDPDDVSDDAFERFLPDRRPLR